MKPVTLHPGRCEFNRLDRSHLVDSSLEQLFNVAEGHDKVALFTEDVIKVVLSSFIKLLTGDYLNTEHLL